MSGDPITRLNAALEGRYRIERELGEGGMATVYLADDMKHERKVALKVLKPELAAVVGAERFLAEIKTTANLQHPHILPLHDSGEADGFLYYVMPYIDGETLRERLDREHQLPVDDAVRIATYLAEALDYAHRHGVIHRDIKPGNVLIHDGQPVISDFGIALAVGTAGQGRLTETGLSVGTPNYMSPEQATGDQAVGAATDIYALGAVLYEMLVGDPPYVGSTAQAILGKIIAGEPESVTAQRKAVPPHVDAAIHKALEKLPADRFGSAQDFVSALADPGFRHGEVAGTGEATGAGPWNRLTLVATALAALFAGAFAWSLVRPEPPMLVERFESPFRDGQGPTLFGEAAFTLSPDGSMLIYFGPSEEATFQFWMRRWEDLDAQPIRGTEGGRFPAISPDGRQLAFDRGGQIHVLSFDGGPIREGLTQGIVPRWGPDGDYLYARTDSGAVRVPATGGPTEQVTQLGDGEVSHWIADFLPGGEVALMRVGFADGRAEIRALRPETGEMTTLTPGAWPRYAASGHLIFLTAVTGASTLMAAPFDLGTMEITGPSVPMIEGVLQYALSETGDLVYISGGQAGGIDTELVWVTRTGVVTPAGWEFDRGAEENYYALQLSPDGTQVAVRALTDGNADIWVKELPDGAARRLTFAEGDQYVPWWSSDGRAVTHLSGGDVWSVPVDGTGAPTLIHDGERSYREGTGSPDGEWLVLRTTASVAGRADQPDRDLVALRPGVDSVPRTLMVTEQFAETQPELSDDGRWLAYASTETGQYEVWVRPFPDVDSGKYPVSQDGGRNPRWAHSGTELFYLTPGQELVAVQFDTASGFGVVTRETLFTLRPEIVQPRSTMSTNPYAVSADDQRFLMGRQLAGASTPAYVLVKNWFTELRELMGGN